MITDAKKSAVRAALAQIEKNFGKGAIMRLGDHEQVKIETVSSGAISIDLALGGGYPRGRIIEIFGPESSGKTTLALHAAAEFQKKGGIVAFVDAEHALDPIYAKKVGVDTDELLLSQPDSGEQALEIVEALVRSGGIDLIIVDSVAALTPPSGNRGGDGRRANGASGATHEPSDEETHGYYFQNEYDDYFPQPDPNEDWSDVWKPRNDNRGECLKILFFSPH